MLRTSQSFQQLSSWIQFPKTQLEAIRLLRGPLANCAGELVGVFRAVEFNQSDSARREVTGAGRDSMGRSVQREALSQGRDLPEEIVFNLPVFDLPGAQRFKIPCALDVQYEISKFALLPVGDAINDVTVGALNSIAATIQSYFNTLETAVEVYVGDANLIRRMNQ